ncbi:sirohydrochlorin chelatase [Streptomyces sp. WG7]|uniref:sirohydrochlorin chelatase n=1 Tax=Streptomyces sp. WG7 TaxID=3417650 RepID=UPI003CE7CE98
MTGGRELFRRVRAVRARGEPVCVVPMTLGRDPELVADAARTLLGLSAEERAGTVLAEPFGTTEHLTGWLRAAATRVPETSALLVTAPSGDPFVDADLFRIARLVRQYGRHRTVEVALTGGDPDPAEGVRRCRALGAERVVLLPAAWAAPPVPDPEHCEPGGPLLAASAVAGVLGARVAEAWHLRDRHGDDGLSRSLTAADAHGHSHSHGPGGHSHGPGGHSQGPGEYSHGPSGRVPAHGLGGPAQGPGGGRGQRPGEYSHGPGGRVPAHAPGGPAPVQSQDGQGAHGSPRTLRAAGPGPAAAAPQGARRTDSVPRRGADPHVLPSSRSLR